MKLGKCISLFFVCSIISLCVGIFFGYRLEAYFYPDEVSQESIEAKHNVVQEAESVIIYDEPVLEVSAQEDRLNADTVYVTLEMDMDTETVVETSSKLPAKYMGMNREQFIESLQDYEANPPLTELERGFVNVQLISFSTERVEVQLNYQYVKPTGSFYIVVYDNKVLVMLSDKTTVYQDTEITLSELPYEIQLEIMQGLFIPNEESLYDFLENYTS
ncbi:MAG: hypothetical protein IJ379_04475 [Lachnospiraceae bacterium]|nr:hypothetical protein [Lachnospiraceae bacterium]